MSKIVADPDMVLEQIASAIAIIVERFEGLNEQVVELRIVLRDMICQVVRYSYLNATALANRMCPTVIAIADVLLAHKLAEPRHHIPVIGRLRPLNFLVRSNLSLLTGQLLLVSHAHFSSATFQLLDNTGTKRIEGGNTFKCSNCQTVLPRTSSH